MSLCLSMIVKDEAHVIQRCLRSVRPYIDSYSISDTGSTDNTMELIRQELEGIPGVLMSDPWQDFATNRNISFARAKGDYVLFVDADEVLEFSGEPIAINTECDAFFLRIEIPMGQIWFPRLLRNDPRWKWQFKVHEHPVFDGVAKVAKLDGLSLRGFFDSHQNVSGDKSVKLLELLYSEEQTPRVIYHIAHLLGTIGRQGEAIIKFHERARMGGDEAEIYTALWMAAALMPQIGKPFDEVAAAYYRAYIFRPSRYEALVGLCELLRSKELYTESYNLSSVDPEPTADLILVDEKAVWRIIEEHALASFYLGKRDEARQCFLRVMEFEIPPDVLERTKNNLTYFN